MPKTGGNEILNHPLALFTVVGAVISFFFFAVYLVNQPSTASSSSGASQALPLQPTIPPIRVGPSFNEVDSKMDDRISSWTEAQKQAYWQSVAGTQVTWTGQVIEVESTGGGEIRLKCNPKTWGSDTVVSLDGTQTANLPRINKNQYISFTGILNDHSSFGYTITQARVGGI